MTYDVLHVPTGTPRRPVFKWAVVKSSRDSSSLMNSPSGLRDRRLLYKCDASFAPKEQFRCFLQHLVLEGVSGVSVEKFHLDFGGHSRNPLDASLSSIILVLIVSPLMMNASSDSRPGHSLTVFLQDLSERTFSAQNGYDLHCAGLASYVVHFFCSSR